MKNIEIVLVFLKVYFKLFCWLCVNVLFVILLFGGISYLSVIECYILVSVIVVEESCVYDIFIHCEFYMLCIVPIESSDPPPFIFDTTESLHIPCLSKGEKLSTYHRSHRHLQRTHILWRKIKDHPSRRLDECCNKMHAISVQPTEHC